MAAVELATAYVALTVETRNVAKEVQRGFDPAQKIADREGAKAGKGFLRGMKPSMAGVAGLFSGAMAGLAVKNFLGDAIAEARESQKVTALTNSIIRSTGGAAKISAEGVGALAEALSNKTGIDDEAIQTGSNLLLTFKNVRNEAGLGNDMFNQATAAALDLSKAGFGSVEGASKMLGKALNDPIKGIAALGRAGVTFTQAQKDQIKVLVESGDVLGAQKVIMQEVQSQVGGAAAATATAGEKARVTFDNLKESAGAKLLPIIDSLAVKFTELVEEWKAGTGTGGQLRDVFNGIVAGVKGAVDFTVRYKDILLPLAGGILAIVGAIKVWTTVTRIYAAAQAVMNAVMLANPIGLVILAIVGLIAVFVLAWKNSEKFRDIVMGVINRFKEGWAIASANFRTSMAAIGKKWDEVKAQIKTGWDWVNVNVIQRWKEGWRIAGENFRASVAAIKQRWQEGIDKIKAGWNWVDQNAIQPFNRGIASLKDKFRTAVTNIGTEWDKLKARAKEPIKWVIQTVLNRGLIGGFNWLSGKIGGPQIKDIPLPSGFKAGGVLPGYTPGRDVHRFISPTGGILDLSGGEGILVPQVTRALGGARGIADLNAGRHPLLHHAMAGGGIIDWLREKGSEAFAWVADKASDLYRAVTNPLDFLRGKLPQFPNGTKTVGQYGKAAVEKGLGLGVQKIKDLWRIFRGAYDEAGLGPANLADMRRPGTGYKVMTSWLKQHVPGASVSSGYRPGAITALGNPSRHGMGLAIDIVPHNLSTFGKILSGIGLRNLKQLYYSPAGPRNVNNGAYWNISGVTKRDHYDHIHWAMAKGGVIPTFDQGGTLRPGINVVNNATGGDEVLRPVGSGVTHLHLELDGKEIAEVVIDHMTGGARVQQRRMASGRVAS